VSPNIEYAEVCPGLPVPTDVDIEQSAYHEHAASSRTGSPVAAAAAAALAYPHELRRLGGRQLSGTPPLTGGSAALTPKFEFRLGEGRHDGRHGSPAQEDSAATEFGDGAGDFRRRSGQADRSRAPQGSRQDGRNRASPSNRAGRFPPILRLRTRQKSGTCAAASCPEQSHHPRCWRKLRTRCTRRSSIGTPPD
jgi:hypothetical protein